MPLDDEVKMYVCGITPYAPSHVGHAMSYIYFDVLRRYLEYKGYKVRHVQNFTDIDDKIIDAATQAGIPTQALAEEYISEYFQDMDALNISRAHIYPQATQEIDKILELLDGLIVKGLAYPSAGDVYFRISKFSDYGKLSHRTLDGMMAGARVDVIDQKEHPMDFTLWKSAKPGEPSWDSPWGPGRPGWHIECSAMSLKYLGENLDIHGGGQDLIFPHHENEIAQSEGYTGFAPFARFWIHNGLLQLNENKMSKSLGNLVTVKDALAQFSPDSLRMFFLTSHYRNPLSYSDESIAAQEKALERIRSTIQLENFPTSNQESLDPQPFRSRFLSSMDEDLNTPQALGCLFDLVREINIKYITGADISAAQTTLVELGGILGLTFQQPTRSKLEIDPFVDLLVEIRVQLRQIKSFELADKVRSRLEELNIALEDSSQGTRWKFTKP
jgi:cysteinyl-tRNA synthetase